MSCYKFSTTIRFFSFVVILLSAISGLTACGGSGDNPSDQGNETATAMSEQVVVQVEPANSEDIVVEVTEPAITVTVDYQQVVETGFPAPPVVVTYTSTAARSLESISIAPFIDTLAKGSQQAFTVTGFYSDNSKQNISKLVTWSVDDSQKAIVDEAGNINTLAEGIVTITAVADTEQSVSKQLTITSATLDSIEIIPALSEVTAGTHKNYQAIGHYSDGSLQNITQQVLWQSSDSSVASMSAAKLITFSAGQSQITASVGKVIAHAGVKVSPAQLERIEIDSFASSLAKGTQHELTVKGYFSDFTSQDITNVVSWQVAEASIISVNADTAILSALEQGSTELTASFDGISVVKTVQVRDALLLDIDIQPRNPVVAVGQRQAFKATAIYSDQTTQDITRLVNWHSSDLSLADIDNRLEFNGEAYTFKAGLTSISASYQQYQVSTQFTINDAELVNIEVRPSHAELIKGLQQQFIATAYYSDGSQQLVTDQVQWSSTDVQVSHFVGNEPGLFKANSVGESKIIAALSHQQSFTSLKVIESELTGLSIITEATPIPEGIGQRLKAIGNYSDGSSIDVSLQVVWQVMAPEVASISTHNGYIMIAGVNTGSTEVIAKLGETTSFAAIDVVAATLQQIQLIADSNFLYVNQQLQLRAEGVFSDGSVQDVSNLVSWISDAPDVAGVSNYAETKGLLKAFSAGMPGLYASYSGITSETINLNIVDDPNIPAALSIQASPNVIFNNGLDNTSLMVTVKPLQQRGVIADDTVIKFTIQDNGVSRTENIHTLDGVAILELSSESEGFISIQAELPGFELTATTSVFSTSNFNRVLQVIPLSRVVYNQGEYLQGSLFGLYLRNLSNRDFSLLSFQTRNGTEHLASSPVIDPQYLSGGVLSSSEYTGIIYQLDNDVVDNGISASYVLADQDMGQAFGFTVRFSRQ